MGVTGVYRYYPVTPVYLSSNQPLKLNKTKHEKHYLPKHKSF